MGEIAKMLEGQYIMVHSSLWDHIPVGAHIRYFVAGNEPSNVRFRVGGFVRTKFVNDKGKKMMRLGQVKYARGLPPGADISWVIEYDNIAQIWKKYDINAFVEIHMISVSLAEKKQQIANLQETVRQLQERVAKLEQK